MARQDHEATAEGVWFQSGDAAKRYAEIYDKDLVAKDGCWIAKNRATNAEAMPTKDGDVVIYHLHQLYRVWVATQDGAQHPDPNVDPITVWSADEAEQAAKRCADETGGRIFQVQKDGHWNLMSN